MLCCNPMQRLFSRSAAMGLLISLVIFEMGGPVFSAESSAQQTASEQISTEELLSSPFAQAFKEHQYSKALKALDALSRRYPNDPLILRYRAATLLRLGRTREAIAIDRQLLKSNPQHVPTRLFLGQAYQQSGDAAAAAEQWRWVSEHSDSGEYRRWAEAQLHRLRVKAKPPLPKRRPYFFAVTGLKYDSNPLFKPNDKALAKSGNEKSGFLGLLDLTLGYPVWMESNSRLDVLYIGPPSDSRRRNGCGRLYLPGNRAQRQAFVPLCRAALSG